MSGVTFKYCQCGARLNPWQGHAHKTIELSTAGVWAATREDALYGIWPDDPAYAPPQHDVVVQPFATGAPLRVYPGAHPPGEEP